MLQPPVAIVMRRANQSAEQRMRRQRLALELGMEPRNTQASRHQLLFVLAIEFVTVAMTFGDLQLPLVWSLGSPA
jgi:hypothetical protein